ncbi:hypothetical protein SXCC_03164 [Gluconacetobacter sp. SXCC-1]|nr:hypothetical protein SXCC_03164 [Gluconacetobacter sp. SXCC-1]
MQPPRLACQSFIRCTILRQRAPVFHPRAALPCAMAGPYSA